MKIVKAKERASWAVDQLVASGMDTSAKNHRRIEDIIERLLKEQDRDTRHACAEAVTCLDDGSCETNNGDPAISTHKAINACMNAKAT